MKTLIILVFLFTAFSSFAVTIITKENKGLFGYRDIKEHHWFGHGELNHSLNCTNPGWKGCKWDNPLTNNSGNSILETIDLIEDRVEYLIINGNFDDEFRFGDYFVEYLYNEDTGRLEIRIYTEEEYHNKESN